MGQQTNPTQHTGAALLRLCLPACTTSVHFTVQLACARAVRTVRAVRVLCVLCVLCVPRSRLLLQASECELACSVAQGTPFAMGGIHPRSKKPVGDRLGVAAFNSACVRVSVPVIPSLLLLPTSLSLSCWSLCLSLLLLPLAVSLCLSLYRLTRSHTDSRADSRADDVILTATAARRP